MMQSRQEAIGDGDGSVGVGARIHDNAVIDAIGFLQLIDENPFVIGLEIVQTTLGKQCLQTGKVVVKRNLAVELWLTGAKQVQVGTIKDQYFFHVAKLRLFFTIFVANIPCI